MRIVERGIVAGGSPGFRADRDDDHDNESLLMIMMMIKIMIMMMTMMVVDGRSIV